MHTLATWPAPSGPGADQALEHQHVVALYAERFFALQQARQVAADCLGQARAGQRVVGQLLGARPHQTQQRMAGAAEEYAGILA